MEEALERYYQHFKENYPLMIVSNMSDDEIIKDIEHCIETNEKAKEPEFDNNADY